ncbi:DNA-3-methyladenine glycosylase family protein [Microvirga massiliensis]|uniref:DNA-3-methyladenine glycosylase family protein n=1 Tax=Microvirga massiliensis TaxID=1033741 RepID=UPI00062B651C|nr:DNA-3-methyladenine glycosylase [Microvirga massiliensis]
MTSSSKTIGPPARLATQADLETAITFLVERDVMLAPLAGDRPALRRRPDGFPGLAAIIVAQQVSTASATAILSRLIDRFPVLSPETIRAAPDTLLREAGLSAAKIRTIRATAEACLSGSLPLDRLGSLPSEEADELLTSVSGIGPWTAEVYRLFCLGDADALPAGDLALQEAARSLYDLPSRPGRSDFTALAERWRPLRGAAAHLLWSHYRRLKGRAGIIANPTDERSRQRSRRR